MMTLMDIGTSIDLYIGDLARQGKSPATRASYRRLLCDFADSTSKRYVHELELTDYERFLDRWTDSAPSTLASGVSLVKRYSYFLWDRKWAETWVAEPLKRPKRPQPEDIAVVSVSSEEVSRMISGCNDWQELLCLTTAAYLGARRAALGRVRLHDVDFGKGTIRFLEKGGKPITKPMPDEYLAILRAAKDDGLWSSSEDYLIPNRRPASVRRSERSDKVIWETVKRVAARVGVRSHVHALRAAFAVQFDEAHSDQVIALKELMGHKRLETTLVYLRRKNKAKAMEAVRDLSWKSDVFPSFAAKAHTGFEPVSSEDRLPEPIRRKLAEFRTKALERKKGTRA